MSLRNKYLKEMNRKYGFNPVWTPDSEIELGSIGTFEDNEFKATNPDGINLQLNIQNDSTPSQLTYLSSKDVSFDVKVAGSAKIPGSQLGIDDAGFSIHFGSGRTTFFKAKNVTMPVITNLDSLGEQIIKLYKQGIWKKEWVIVTKIIKAESAVILISQNNNSRYDIKVGASANLGSVDIVDAVISSEFVNGGSTVMEFKGHDMTPLCKIMSLTDNFLSDPAIHLKSMPGFIKDDQTMNAMGVEEELVLDEVEFTIDEEKQTEPLVNNQEAITE